MICMTIGLLVVSLLPYNQPTQSPFCYCIQNRRESTDFATFMDAQSDDFQMKLI